MSNICYIRFKSSRLFSNQSTLKCRDYFSPTGKYDTSEDVSATRKTLQNKIQETNLIKLSHLITFSSFIVF